MRNQFGSPETEWPSSDIVKWWSFDSQLRTQCYIFIKSCVPQPIPLTVHLALHYDLAVSTSAVPQLPAAWPLAYLLTALRNEAVCISQVPECIPHFTSAYKVSLKCNPGTFHLETFIKQRIQNTALAQDKKCDSIP